MSTFLYPVDTDQFQTIRQMGKLYVDKTHLVYDLAYKYQYVFLARPRRFGKSLLCNTFKAYFQGKKELFAGLKLASLEKQWTRHPVLHFTLSGLKNVSVEEAKTKLGCLIQDYEQIYGATDQQLTPGGRFRHLIHQAAQQTGEKVVVIIDEYDAGIMRIVNQKHQLYAMRTMLREFYQVLKDEGEYLRFVFITGITKFSQVSIFSELNNLKQISMLDAYSGICGITQDELNTTLRPCVEEFAQSLHISTAEAYTLLKKNYDGYHFSPYGEDVYAPFSLLNALNDGSANHYWFETGTSTALLEHLKHYPITKALDYDGVKVRENEFCIPCEDADTPMPLLYQSGYLTIQSYNPLLKQYVLKIPNSEVREGLINCLMPLILKRSVADNNGLAMDMAEAIYKGDLESALSAFRSYIAKIPYDIITKEEWDNKEAREAFYKLLFYMAFSMLNSIVDTEVKSELGRADVVIQTRSHIFVLELKVDQSAEEALRQIDDKGYGIPFEADKRTLIKCGVSISSQSRNITQWCATNEDGITIFHHSF
ncbi:MAG: AAA family ATPase [Sodaliphilus sp.]